MFRNANDVRSGSRIDCDVCVIGAGAAGITVAQQFARTRAGVCLLESGGTGFEERTQALYAGTTGATGHMGDQYLVTGRLRYFGGTTNHWASWCGPLDPEALERRPWVPHSGWPISLKDLTPYYREAQKLCGLGKFDYDIEHWRGPGQRTPMFSDDVFVTRMWQRRPRPVRFGQRYRAELHAARHIHVYLYANAVNLQLARDGGRVELVDVATLEGRRFTVRAKQVVLASGGLENPRLLLASRGVAPFGVGNAHDLVGRFYMDHPHPVSIGTALLASDAVKTALELTDTPGDDGRFLVTTAAVPSREVQAREGLLLGSFAVNDQVQLPEAPHERAALHSLARFAGVRESDVRRANLIAILENSPNPESRVTLQQDRDELGVPRIHLDWRFNAIDRESLLRSCELLGDELGSRGLGRLRLADWLLDGDPWPSQAERGGPHQIGTTRMDPSPRRGVVDTDCRVHGVRNLYVAGSSVYPTSGRMNPTLTIVALAVRIAEHVSRQL